MGLYFLMLRIAALFNNKAKQLVRGQRDAWGILQNVTPGSIWVHAASVGEFEQARPIIEHIKQEHPERKILLTFFSPSGYNLRKNYDKADWICYLPFATRRNAKRLVQMVQPSMALFIKYEFWPAYLKALKKNGVATYSISSIFLKSQAFFRWYGAPYRRVLHNFTHLFVQNEASKELLAKYKITNVTVVGDTRFDRVYSVVMQQAEHQQTLPVVERFTHPFINPLLGQHYSGMPILPEELPIDNCPTIVAGSTWPKDEVLLKQYMDSHPHVRMILVPHEVNTEHLHYIFNLFEGKLVRLSNAHLNNVSSNRVLLVDTVGQLLKLYPYGDVAYIGGGFGVGIHNTLEAATWGMPVVFGPNYQRFREAHGLIDCGAGFAIHNYATLEAALDNAIANSDTIGTKSAEYVRSELGATEKIVKAVF